jgi:hypothetical protein
LQRQASNQDAAAAPDHAEQRTQSARPQGMTLNQAGTQLSAHSTMLEESARTRMEAHFGADFRHVRIHTGPEAQAAAEALRANAFTIGNHIFFGAGQYSPETTGGRSLIAHELTHVIQQADAPIGVTSAEASDSQIATMEQEAESMGRSVTQDGFYAPPQQSQAQARRITVAPQPLGFLLARRPGQGYLDCVNECLSNAGFAATVGGIIVGICGVIAALAAAAATPETGGTATVPTAVLVAAACAGAALGVPTGLMAACLWDCR